MSRFTFDMPHALVTLTDVEGNVEIEVWPKAGQSAYVVVPPPIARAIADQIVRMADAAEAGRDGSDDDGSDRSADDGSDGLDDGSDASAPAPVTNVVDLASRRRPD